VAGDLAHGVVECSCNAVLDGEARTATTFTKQALVARIEPFVLAQDSMMRQ
jgi:hypothetical protein